MSGPTSPTGIGDSKVPRLLPVLKRSHSSQELLDAGVPLQVPKLLPVRKRSNSTQGIPDPAASPVTTSPPPVKVKQEKPESPTEFSPCHESMKKVGKEEVCMS